MSKMSIVKVTDAKTGKLKRYEDEKGRAVAVVKNGRLQITASGADLNLVVRNNKLHEIGAQYPSVQEKLVPGKIRKLPNKNKYRVYWGGKVAAKATSKKKAEAQLRLLKGKK